MPLFRSRRDCKVFGLCGGLAEMLGIDATLLRLIVVVTTFFSGGTVLLIYIIASLIVPKEPPLMSNPGHGYQHAGPGPSYEPPHGARTDYEPRKSQQRPGTSHIDDMMDEIEKKAMQREIDELREKIKKMEKGE